MSSEDARASIDTLIAELRTVDDSAFPCGAGYVQNITDEAYLYFLDRSNGGYTPDNYFHFFGRSENTKHDIVKWNSLEAWKNAFSLGSDFFVFAEDIFGNQYGYLSLRRGQRIRRLSILTGELTPTLETFEDFVDLRIINKDAAYETESLAAQFLSVSPYKDFHHLSFDVHPCLGGAPNDIQNLRLIDSQVNLSFTGQLLNATRLLPPGTRIKEVRFDKERGTVSLIPDTGQ